MIEKIARAICIECYGDDVRWKFYIPSAKAVLKTMLNPTAKMQDAGLRHSSCSMGYFAESDNIYKAMIKVELVE